MRIIVVGEGMVEMSRKEDAAWSIGYGGDTLNTAIHLARYGHDVAFATALGTDPFSVDLRSPWQAEGLDTGLMLTHPTRACGLYAIQTDATGERSFHYWRAGSAAAALFDLPASDGLVAALSTADLLYFSAISLAILTDAARTRLLECAGAVRRSGGQVVFDSNYRPRLWSGVEAARHYRDAGIAVASIGLPTLEDEQALSGFADADAVASHWMALGARETIVKLGALGCRLPEGALIPPPALVRPVDTSGAGDAFNAGYLHGRLSGRRPSEAASIGHRLAGWVVSRPGAIPAREDGVYGDASQSA